MTTQNPFEDAMKDLQEVKSSWVKWGKVGDYVRGTLVSIREMNSNLPGKEGERVKVYELLTECGQFHDIDNDKKPVEPAITIGKGEYWQIGGKVGIDNQMRNVKIGQIIGMVFAEVKPSKTKGFNSLKIIKVRVGGMDPNFGTESLGTEMPTF